MTAGTPAPQDAETVDEVQALDAVIFESLDALGHLDRTGSTERIFQAISLRERVQAALVPVRAREVEAARREGAREALLDAAGGVWTQTGVQWGRPDWSKWLRDLAATHADDEQHDTKEDDRG